MSTKTFKRIVIASTTLLIPLAANAQTWQQDIDAGEKAYQNGQKDQAEQEFTQALKEAESAHWNDQRLARTLNDLGVVFDENKNYKEAESYYKRALNIRKKTPGPDSLEVADTVNNLANLYKDQNRYKDAEPLYQQAINIYTKHQATANLAMSFNNLGTMYMNEGKGQQAIDSLKKALQYGDKALGPSSDHVVDIVSRLATESEKLGKTADAKLYYQRYLQNVKRTLGLKKGDPNTVSQLHKFADWMRRNNQAGDADLVEKAITYDAK